MKWAPFSVWWSALLVVMALGLVWLAVRPNRPERWDLTWPALFAVLLVLPAAIGQWRMWMPAAWAVAALVVGAAWWLKRMWGNRNIK